MTGTLMALVIWTTAGLIDDGPRWTSLSCGEVVKYAEETVDRYGGQFELSCEEFAPLHEADLNPDFSWE